MSDQLIRKLLTRLSSSKLTVDRLNEILDYEPMTGRFVWKRAHGRRKVGDTAGFESGGYIYLGIDGERFAAHHLAWLFIKGVWPTTIVDHRDAVGTNNAWANLREATRAQNNANSAVRSHNISGVKGVTLRRNGRFIAMGAHPDGRRKYLGTFDNADDAHAAFLENHRERYGDFSRST